MKAACDIKEAYDIIHNINITKYWKTTLRIPLLLQTDNIDESDVQ